MGITIRIIYCRFLECIEWGLKFVLTVRRSVVSYLPNYKWLWKLKTSVSLWGKTKDNGLSCLKTQSIFEKSWKCISSYHLIQYQNTIKLYNIWSYRISNISLALPAGLEAVLAAKSPKVKGPMKQVLIFSTAAWEHRLFYRKPHIQW